MNDIFLIVGVMATMGAVTFVIAVTAGRKIAKRARAAAIILCGFIVPLILIAGAYVDYYLTSANPGDGSAMALVGTVIYAVLALPLTLILSFIAIRRRPAPEDVKRR